MIQINAQVLKCAFATVTNIVDVSFLPIMGPIRNRFARWSRHGVWDEIRELFWPS